MRFLCIRLWILLFILSTTIISCNAKFSKKNILTATNTIKFSRKNMLTTTNTTKPGCPRKCGNLTIPYPFGIGFECAINFYFTLTCKTSYNPPRAFTMLDLGTNQYAEVLYISETQLLLRNSQIAFKCYDSNGNVTSQSIMYYDLVDSPFTFSKISNKLTVVGCDDYALIGGYTGILANGSKIEYNTVGCLALCSNPMELTPGACSGLGCCQSSIPIGLQSFLITLSSLQNHTAPRISSFQPCAYAFLSGGDSFKFGGLGDFSQNRVIDRTRDKIPLVLDWFVGDLNFSSNTRPNCDEIKRNLSAYACQSNTQCVDVVGGGYHCRCKPGYEGNPYLKPGCTDFDECASSSNPCSRICHNTPGSFECLCPNGYFGDGWKNFGNGCTKNTDNLKKLALGLGISLGSTLVLLFGWCLYALFRKKMITRQKVRHFKRNRNLLLQQQMPYDEIGMARMKIFSADELDKATDHFSEDRILGKGGQGTVYKGMLSKGRIVAIKKPKILDESHLIEFINEMVILSQINHRNIVKLWGCCLETEVPLLVYEFISNGTLFDHIHYPSEEFPITWRMRLQIASDSAGALSYLHLSSVTPILHRDIKSSNILLDNKYRAKLADFGTSRSIALDQTHVTTRVVGTFGYFDPEYFRYNRLTEKSDVYSFAVVLVELITGQKAIRSIHEENRSLTSWFLSHMENSRLLDIVDNQILKEGSKEEFQTIANLAKRCLNFEGKNRPTMKEVLLEIEAVLSLHLPQQHVPNLEHTPNSLPNANSNSLNSDESTLSPR